LPLDKAKQVSTTVVDRNGKLLRAYAMEEGRWRLPVGRQDDVDPRYLKLLFAYEDKRFYEHHGGVDPLALSRRWIPVALRGEIVSGGSTITMQVARLLEPRIERTLGPQAAADGARARARTQALEQGGDPRSLSPSLAPYGGNLEGVRAASLAYFGKEPKRLSLRGSRAAGGLPQSPEAPAARPRPRSAPGRARRGCSTGSPSERRSVPTEVAATPCRARARSAKRCRRSPLMRPIRRRRDAGLGLADRHADDPARPAARFEMLARDRAIALGPKSPSRSWWSDHARPATCWPGSARRIISTSGGPGRST
jgi:penicillin-binding protein 1C